MKNHILPTVVAVLITCCATVALAQEPVASSLKVSAGSIEFYPQFKSQYMSARNVTVWLPDGYRPGEPCDVLYMHDGQMLFDAGSTWNHQEWMVDEVLGRLINEGKTRRCIVVGIDNSPERLNDYFPTKCYNFVPGDKRGEADATSSKGDEYLKMLVNEVKPFIDNHYHPLTGREHTFVMGSSMGGLISLYALCEYPQVFGGAVCMSTHVSMQFFNPSFDSDAWAQGFRDYVKSHLATPNSALIYMDRGTVELDGTYKPAQDLMDATLRGLGWDEKHFTSRVFEGHKHMETFWAERLDQPLLFILEK